MSTTYASPTVDTTRDTEQIALPIEVAHVTYLAGRQFHCIQEDCDREHHFWCSCAA